VNALIPFCHSAISGLQQHFIAASSLTAATVTRRSASTSEWKIRVFTGGNERGRKAGDTATDSAQQVAPLPRAFLSPGLPWSLLPLFSVALVVLSPHLLLVQLFDAAFARRLSPPSLMSSSFLATLLSLAFPSA